MPFLENFSVSEGLGVSKKLLRDLATAYEGYALIRANAGLPLRPIWDESMRVDGSDQEAYRWPIDYRVGYMARAASYWAVVEARRARKCFAQARNFLLEEVQKYVVASGPREEGSDFQNKRFAVLRVVPLQLLAGDSSVEILRELSQVVQLIKVDPKPEVMRIVLTAVSSLSGESEKEMAAMLLRNFGSELENLSAFPVGRLALPLRLYLQSARLALIDADQRPKRLLETSLVQEFGERLNDRIEVARSIGNHWRRAQSGLLPLEPELLALLAPWMENAHIEDIERLVELSPRYLKAYLVAAYRILTTVE